MGGPGWDGGWSHSWSWNGVGTSSTRLAAFLTPLGSVLSCDFLVIWGTDQSAGSHFRREVVVCTDLGIHIHVPSQPRSRLRCLCLVLRTQPTHQSRKALSAHLNSGQSFAPHYTPMWTTLLFAFCKKGNQGTELYKSLPSLCY